MEDKYSNREWRKLALCKQKTTQFFRHRCSARCLNHKNGCNRVKVVRDCKSICEKCPVLEHCRIWAIEADLLKGIAGGMTEIERREATKIIKGDTYEQEPTTDYC